MSTQEIDLYRPIIGDLDDQELEQRFPAEALQHFIGRTIVELRLVTWKPMKNYSPPPTIALVLDDGSECLLFQDGEGNPGGAIHIHDPGGHKAKVVINGQYCLAD